VNLFQGCIKLLIIEFYTIKKETPDGKGVGTVVPMHDELKIGTLKSILKLGKVDEDEFSEFL